MLNLCTENPSRVPSDCWLEQLSYSYNCKKFSPERMEVKAVLRIAYNLKRLKSNWPSSCSPIHSESPELSLPAASAKPPPNKRITPQGIFFSTMLQDIRAGEDVIGLFGLLWLLERKMSRKIGLEGRRKRSSAIMIAGVASVLPIKHYLNNPKKFVINQQNKEQLMYISTSVGVLHALKAVQNLLFLFFTCFC